MEEAVLVWSRCNDATIMLNLEMKRSNQDKRAPAHERENFVCTYICLHGFLIQSFT